MTDKQRLDCALSKIVTESETCYGCDFRHYSERDYAAWCFFAVDCICHNHKDYKEKVDEE